MGNLFFVMFSEQEFADFGLEGETFYISVQVPLIQKLLLHWFHCANLPDERGMSRLDITA